MGQAQFSPDTKEVPKKKGKKGGKNSQKLERSHTAEPTSTPKSPPGPSVRPGSTPNRGPTSTGQSPESRDSGRLAPPKEDDKLTGRRASAGVRRLWRADERGVTPTGVGLPRKE